MSTRSPVTTLKDLALHLGVHKSTVSRAMDAERRHLVAADLLQRIEAAARELGYRPNHAAAALSRGRSKTVGVLLPDITNPVFPPILRGIEDALDEEGYFALLANTSRPDHSVDAAQVAVERMQAQRVEGFLVATATRDDAWLERLRQSGARIVLIGSRTANGSPTRSQYAATKAALVGMARSWAAELAPRGITVNVLAPGATDTPFLRDPARAQTQAKVPPIGRFVQPEEVAGLAAFLLGPQGGAMTGQHLVMCGGASL